MLYNIFIEHSALQYKFNMNTTDFVSFFNRKTNLSCTVFNVKYVSLPYKSNLIIKL